MNLPLIYLESIQERGTIRLMEEKKKHGLQVYLSILRSLNARYGQNKGQMTLAINAALAWVLLAPPEEVERWLAAIPRAELGEDENALILRVAKILERPIPPAVKKVLDEERAREITAKIHVKGGPNVSTPPKRKAAS